MEWEAGRSTLVGRPTDRRPPSPTSRRGTPHLPASRSAIHTIHTSGSVFRIRNPVPFWPLDPGWVKSQDPNPGFRIRVEQPVSYYLELRNHFLGLKYFNSLIRIRSWKNSDPGSGINIPDPQHYFGSTSGSSLFADLLICIQYPDLGNSAPKKFSYKMQVVPDFFLLMPPALQRVQSVYIEFFIFFYCYFGFGSGPGST